VLPVRFGYKFLSESDGFTGRVNVDILDRFEIQYFS
jgi:hypothetical protein